MKQFPKMAVTAEQAKEAAAATLFQAATMASVLTLKTDDQKMKNALALITYSILAAGDIVAEQAIISIPPSMSQEEAKEIVAQHAKEDVEMSLMMALAAGLV